MSLTTSVLAVTAAVMCCAPRAPAAFHDFYWTDPSPVGPFDPTPNDLSDPTAGWNWDPDKWTHKNTTGVVPDGTVMKPDTFLVFGLENKFIKDETKTFWVTFHYQGGDPKATNAKWGNHPKNGDVGGGSMSELDEAGVYKFTVVTKPQPDWEWVVITNVGTSDMKITSFKMDSSCTPTPGSIAVTLVGVACVMCRRR